MNIGDREGYIDRNGKIEITPQFNIARPFAHGLAAVGVGGKIGYIDRRGRFVWNPTS